MKIGSIVIRCKKFDEMLAFWQEALHYIPKEPQKADGLFCVTPKEEILTCLWTKTQRRNA